MREELIGYLLGALDAEEQARVEQALSESEQLQYELELLADSLEPLEADAGDYEPPAGLATRTCRLVHQKVTLASAADHLITTGRWSMADMVAAASVCAAALLLFLPALAQSRHQASLAHCQDNLRSIGVALASYSDSNRGYLPAIPHDGKLSVAGIYAPTLVELGFLTDASRFFCTRSDASDSEPRQIPTLAAVEAAEGRDFGEMVRILGGDYAYTLGYVQDGSLQAIHNTRRPYFAILSDAPNLDGNSRVSLNHGGKGQNVLFEDGHIEYLIGCQLGCGDNVFLNDAGYPEAGVHADDSVLGHSSMPPVHLVRLKHE